MAVDVVRRAIIEHLAQRGGEILRVGGGAVADQDTIAVIGVTGAVVGYLPIESVIDGSYYDSVKRW